MPGRQAARRWPWLGALLLASYDRDERLIYAGRAGHRHRLFACLAALRELTLRYRTSLVLCSATLPDLTKHPALKVRLPSAKPIVARSPELSVAFRCVRCERLAETIDDETLVKQLSTAPKVMCIVDSRRHAADLLALLADDGTRFHLSAAMCPQHRREVLSMVKERLAGGLPRRLVTTRVIEAGFDISFPVVWHAIPGVDSLPPGGRPLQPQRRVLGTEPVCDLRAGGTMRFRSPLPTSAAGRRRRGWFCARVVTRWVST
jgi:hypothetical protein